MKLPIGVSDFREIIEGSFEFVDKSIFIKDVINDTKVIHITRPRRFGKTLQLSMLKYFFSNNEQHKASQSLFKDLKIACCGSDILSHQGKYPVIFLSLKDIKANNYKDCYQSLCEFIRDLYEEYAYLLSNPNFPVGEKKIYESILTLEASPSDIRVSLKNLTKYLHRLYDVNPIVLIDEYDTPIQQGYAYGYYSEVMRLFRTFLSSVLKDNVYLYKACNGNLTDFERKFISDLNNIKVYSLLCSRYATYFGLTEEEVVALLKKAKMQLAVEANC